MDARRFTGTVCYTVQVIETVLPIHQITDTLESDVISVLPAIDALTGCCSASKIGDKKTALKVDESGFVKNLLQFGKQSLSETMVSKVEHFLAKRYSQKSKVRTSIWSSNMENTIQKLLISTLKSYHQFQNAFFKRIQRAYYQCYK